MTIDQILVAQELRRLGIGVPEIARVLKKSRNTIRRGLDPEWAAQENDLRQLRRRKKPSRTVSKPHAYKLGISHFRPTEKEFRRAQKLIPKDDRDLTGRLFGDPLPGRSALDRIGRTVL